MRKWNRAKSMPCSPLGNNRSLITGCDTHIQLSRKVASEGTVLLKNDKNVLPLKKGQRCALVNQK